MRAVHVKCKCRCFKSQSGAGDVIAAILTANRKPALKYEKSDDRSVEKREILKEITETMMHRTHLDNSIDFMGKLIFGAEYGPSILRTVRPSGQALVDDWNCLKSMVQVFESHCGSLTQYGMKHMRAFANLCNRGISRGMVEEACASACGSYNTAKWRRPSNNVVYSA